MKIIDPASASVKDVFAALLGGVGPRPIALVSTLSAGGIPNLSPFSFFNAFGANPPTIAFSASRRVRDNTTKHTYENIVANGECVVQTVTHSIVEQVNLASAEYGEGINEFEKSGLTIVPSDIVAPPRVNESPFQMECKLTQMVELGTEGGAGNLAICEVVRFHISDDILTNGRIDPRKLDAVARMGGNFYAHASESALFELPKPDSAIPLGWDQLPDFIKLSDILNANNKAQLALQTTMPTVEDATKSLSIYTPAKGTTNEFFRCEQNGDYKRMISIALASKTTDSKQATRLLILAARRALEFRQRELAWQLLVYAESI